MRLYETMYVVHPALESGRLDDIIQEVEKTLTTCGGEKKSSEVWGKRKLAYMIDKQKYGTYVLLQFSNDGQALNQFNAELKHNPNILAFLTTGIDEKSLLSNKKSAETAEAKSEEPAETVEAKSEEPAETAEENDSDNKEEL